MESPVDVHPHASYLSHSQAPQRGRGDTTTEKKRAKKSNDVELTLEEQLAAAKQQIVTEKAGKRKLFHSIVKLAEELGRFKNSSRSLERQSPDKAWYSGGMWRAPQVLPSVWSDHVEDRLRSQRTSKLMVRESISLTDLFFNLVIVTGFTRVGVAMSEQGEIGFSSFCYFAIFFNVWSKQASYSTRFDTTDLSAQIAHLLTCFAVLFASLSVQAPIESLDANRILIMAAAVALLHCWLYLRVLFAARSDDASDAATVLLRRNLINHATFNILMTVTEAGIWLYGVLGQPVDWNFRWAIFVGALALAGLRIPRAFLANDFHGTFRCSVTILQYFLWTWSHALFLSASAAASKRGLLFILLLGFLLQSVVVVASEFFAYQTPTTQDYSFIGSVCLLFFCIKLLYVNDDEDTLAQDHALLVSRWAAFFYHTGHFFLLLSTTVLGSGLNILTHSYLAATAALPGPEKSLVCGGFATCLVSIFFIKSMHVKRIPIDPRNRTLFIGAYLVQTFVLLAVVGISAAACMGLSGNGVLDYLLQSDIALVFALAGSAVFVLLMSWLDEGLELAVYESVEHSRSYRVSPFGFWFCCLRPTDVSAEEEEHILQDERDLRRRSTSATRLSSVLSPLLAHSVEREMRGYDSVASLNSTPTPGVV